MKKTLLLGVAMLSIGTSNAGAMHSAFTTESASISFSSEFHKNEEQSPLDKARKEYKIALDAFNKATNSTRAEYTRLSEELKTKKEAYRVALEEAIAQEKDETIKTALTQELEQLTQKD